MAHKIEEIDTSHLDKIDMLIEDIRALSMRTQGLEHLFAYIQPSTLPIPSSNRNSPTLLPKLKNPLVNLFYKFDCIQFKF